MLRKLFCLGNGHFSEADSEWTVARTQYQQQQTLYSKTKILDLVEDDIEERYNGLAAKKNPALESSSMRRMHRANLPLEDSQRATHVLMKLTTIDNARKRAEKERASLVEELAALKAEKRMTEFAQARAEQLAIARGEALYNCQERLAASERQQVQLAEALKAALQKLGMELTPSPSPLPRAAQRSPGQLPNRPPGPLDFASEEAALVPLDLPAQRNNNAEVPDTPMSGFTVYSNELHDSPAEDPFAERPASSTKWKDISQVAVISPTTARDFPRGAVTPENVVEAAAVVELQAERLAQLIIPHLEPSQIESLVRVGASAATPFLTSPTMQRHIVEALHKSREPIREEQQRPMQQPPQMQEHVEQPRPQQQVAPVPSALPCPSIPSQMMPQDAGPLSQAAGWASPGLNDASRHIKLVATRESQEGFYKPFSAGFSNVLTAAANESEEREVRDAAAMPAHPPRMSTFNLQQKTGLEAPLNGEIMRSSGDGDTIKALRPESAQKDDQFARQRRAAERIAQKINSKLPPEYRSADPLCLGYTSISPSAGSAGSGSGGKRPPKGSLRRRAESEALTPNSSIGAPIGVRNAAY